VTKLIVLTTFAALLMFQNCGRAKFGGDPGSLVSVTDDSSNTGAGTPSVIEPPPGTLPPGTLPPGTTPPDPVSPGTVTDSLNQRLYVCVLNGKGKSHKIAYITGELLSKNATPADVCMSKEACSEIISQKFDVQGPAFRGFCPDKNPHVVNFSDGEIQALVDAL